ncbi:MAG: hypothetical protein ACLFPQ_04900 [Candidatus Woesearchaeota archaeon]
MTEKISKNLRNYLKLESLLSEFFTAADYCINECISKEKGKTSQPKGIGCCNGNFYLSGSEHIRELEKERISIYGFPDMEDKQEECRYHSEKGCMLKTHKSPLCITFSCDGLKKYLKEQGIDYNWISMQYEIMQTLAGKAAPITISKLEDNIKQYIDRLKRNN